jgi:Fe2+ or Zn2+ uptake regulation protein
VPTVLSERGFRFFFYSNEHLPKHIHIENAGKTAKFNLEDIELVKSSGFSASELKQIRNLVELNQRLLIQKWDEFFSN